MHLWLQLKDKASLFCLEEVDVVMQPLQLRLRLFGWQAALQSLVVEEVTGGGGLRGKDWLYSSPEQARRRAH